MRRIIIGLSLLASMVFAGCYADEDINPTEGGEPFYKLPQGEHSYDPAIVDWFNRCGFYILYDFQETDLYWNEGDWTEADMKDAGLEGNLLGEKANPDYVGGQFDAIQRLFLNLYPEDYLTEGMPLKMLLCSKLQIASTKRVVNRETREVTYVEIYTDTLVHPGFDYVAVNCGNELSVDMSDSLQLELSMGLNSWFLNQIADDDLMEILSNVPEEFYEVSDYDVKNISGNTLFEYGFLSGGAVNITSLDQQKRKDDAISFLALVGWPLELLETPNSYVPNNEHMPCWRGVFDTATKDTQGLVRQKYDIMLEYVRSLGINVDKLQNPDLN